jgi:hypothetical protein
MSRALLILALFALGAQPAFPQPLAPGKPAGTDAAQHISYRTGFIGLTIIAVALTFGLPASSSSSTATAAATTS